MFNKIRKKLHRMKEYYRRKWYGEISPPYHCEIIWNGRS